MKEFITWSDEISVGIQEIDDQHKQLILYINTLYDVMIHPKNKEHVVKEIMNNLTQYTIIHFAVEESLFRIFDYPRYEEHKKHHLELAQQVIDINVKVQAGEDMITSELLNFLRKWLYNHIMKEDKLYTPFLLKNGIKKDTKKSWFRRMWDM